MGNYLSHLLSINLASIIEIIDVVTKIVTLFNYMARSAMERIVFGLVNVGWPRFSLLKEMECIIGYKDLKDVSQ